MMCVSTFSRSFFFFLFFNFSSHLFVLLCEIFHAQFFVHFFLVSVYKCILDIRKYLHKYIIIESITMSKVKSFGLKSKQKAIWYCYQMTFLSLPTFHICLEYYVFLQPWDVKYVCVSILSTVSRNLFKPTYVDVYYGRLYLILRQKY